MIFIIGFLTVALVLDCLLLILLVLIQLPKKEAGAGVAFGGAATDALFGAGTGNVLTKTTKYASVTFFVLLLLISIAQSKSSVFNKNSKEFQKEVEKQSKESEVTQPPTTAPAVAPSVSSNILTTTPESLTNLPSAPATNAAPAAPK